MEAAIIVQYYNKYQKQTDLESVDWPLGLNCVYPTSERKKPVNVLVVDNGSFLPLTEPLMFLNMTYMKDITTKLYITPHLLYVPHRKDCHDNRVLYEKSMM